MSNGHAFDIKSIKPPHGQMNGSGKFSPNLYRWMARQPILTPTLVYRNKDGALWIGWFDDTDCFIGARLMRVLCAGAKHESYAILPKDTEHFKILKNFWRDYRRDGRCAIDKAHKMYWATDETRWTVKGNTRSCNWCGKHKQRLHVKTVVHRDRVEEWRPANA